MTTVKSNVSGALEYFGANENGYTVKILANDGKFHIYSNLNHARESDFYNVGDYIGESEELRYEVREDILSQHKNKKGEISMVKIKSNVNGVLEHYQQNEDGTWKVKLLGGDGLFHIYDNLKRANIANEYKLGAFIGEAEKLHYEVRGHYLESIK